uniref:Uncharacterized protein n=1 Tax=Hyaloperonospora arabidopsidis (strain Emoy2) TaxID=559515 RepID=M4BC43_HYAAE
MLAFEYCSGQGPNCRDAQSSELQGAQAKHQSHRGRASEYQSPCRCIAQGGLVIRSLDSAINAARHDVLLVAANTSQLESIPTFIVD